MYGTKYDNLIYTVDNHIIRYQTPLAPGTSIISMGWSFAVCSYFEKYPSLLQTIVIIPCCRKPKQKGSDLKTEMILNIVD